MEQHTWFDELLSVRVLMFLLLFTFTYLGVVLFLYARRQAPGGHDPASCERPQRRRRRDAAPARQPDEPQGL